jgi:signal transduction histidine kinase
VRSIAWPSSRTLAGDGALALALTAIGITAAQHLGKWQPTARPTDPLSYVLVVGAALPLAVRRIWPLATLILSAAATSAYMIIGYPWGPILLSLAIAVYTAAALLPAWRATLGCAAALVALLVHVLVLAAGPQGSTALAGFLPGSAWVVVPFALGQVVRTGREARARTRVEEIERYSYEERLRIAQEVHDVVGHGLTAINMQAEIALHVLPKRPEQAEPALAAISRTSKEALDELRATLAVVRRGEDSLSRTPGPGLGRIHDLVARMSATGITVTVTVSGTPRDLSAAVDLAAYRIVQEALTNVLRHAGPASAAVRIEYQPRQLTIEVTDNGPGTAGATATTGHGVAGMRERVDALGGAFDAGPRLGGGFRIYAGLPLPTATA